MSETDSLGRLIGELRGSPVAEPARLYQICAKAIALRGSTDFETVSFYVIGSVFLQVANKLEGDDAGQGFGGEIETLVSTSLSVLSHKDWESGHVDLVALIELNRRTSDALH